MNWLNSMEWPAALLRASWQAGLLALAVLVIRAGLKERLAPKWRHALWFLVVARLALPLTVEAPWSAFNLLVPSVKVQPKQVASVPALAAMSLEVEGEPPAAHRTGIENPPPVDSPTPTAIVTERGTPFGLSAPVPVTPAPSPIRWSLWLGIVWLGGVVLLGLRLVLAVALFTRRMRQALPVDDAAVLDLLSACSERAAMRHAPRLLESDAVTTPAVCGYWRPRLLMPPGLLATFTPDELRHVFFHELAHIRRRDVAVNWLTSILLILHWCNPLVWLAFSRMRTDREVACDALAIELAGADENRSYGETIIKLLETMARPSLTPALVGILEDRDQLHTRIAMIARFGRASRWSWLAGPLLLALALVTLTDAQTTDAKKKLPPVLPLTITNILAEAENKDWLKDAVWQVAPRGTQDFGGIRFHLEGVVHLKGLGFGARPYRERVTVPVPTNSAWGALHVVGGMAFDTEQGTRVADLVWNYTDGTSRKVPILYAVQARDWWRVKYEKPDRVKDPLSKVVWNARHPDASKYGKTLRLYRMVLPNPRPDKRAKSVEFVTANARPSFIFNALTLDPLKAGERPDDSFDIEELDLEPKGRLQVTVLDSATSNALADATLKISVREQSGSLLQAFYDREFKTGPAGIVEIPVPEEGIDRLQIQASATGFGSRSIVWNPTNNESIPPAHVFSLRGGFTIGGTVVDAEGIPISGAKVNVGRVWISREDDPRNQKGERDDFQFRAVTSGADGVWEVRDIPGALKAKISVSFSHPDFLMTDVWLHEKESELRARSHRLVLTRGTSLSGRVLGPKSEPVAGAKVKVSRRNSSDMKDVSTDQDGRFKLSNVGTNDYERFIAVTAKGYAPLEQAIPEFKSKEEMVLKLVLGSKLAVRVQAVDGQPVSGARWIVRLPSQPAMANSPWSAEGTTGDDGRFEIDADEEQSYRLTLIGEGRERVRDRVVRVTAEDQVVTMRGRRKLVGQALNGETGEPVAGIKVRFGIFAPPGELYGTVRADRSFDNRDGRFEVEFEDDNEDGIRVSADDFEPKILPVTAQDLAAKPFLVRLKPSPSLQGVARTKDGRVLPGATVVVSGPGVSLSLRGGTMIENGVREAVVTTDDRGRFKLHVPENAGLVLASSEGLFGRASVDDVRASGEIVLSGNGKISGVIKLNGKPLPGRRFTAQFMGDRSFIRSNPAESDENGRFHFEDVPFGKCSILEQISMGGGSFSERPGVFVEVVPGQTAEVVIAKTGAVVKGALSPGPSDSAEHVGVVLATGEPPRLVTVDQQPPSVQQIREFEERADVIRAKAAIRRYSAELTAGGRVFSFEAIPPGEYVLDAVVMGKSGSRTAVRKIVVPDAAAGGDEIDLGTVVLVPGSKRKANP